MKIRMGFITNSSSTNFLIISKEELTEEYLFEKLGFIKDGMLEKQGRELCRSIIYALDGGLRYHNYEITDYAYWGYTSSDDSPITQFFTTDSFEIEDKDFYLNGRACVW